MKKLLLTFAIALMTLLNSLGTSNIAQASSFIEDNPQFKRFLFRESDSRFRLGFGLTPFQIIKDKPAFSVSLFQLHFYYTWFAWEIIKASYAMTFGSSPATKIREIVLRSTPQFRINDMLSIGAIIGYEFISFPDVEMRLTKASLNTELEPFSSRGMIYGVSFSENFRILEKYILRAEQLGYRQNYRVAQSENGWTYTLTDSNLNRDRSDMKAGWVLQASFSFLY
jgi:hypothetical protein